jgi:hypothetical protein
VTFPAGWPEGVVERLRASRGEPESVEPLGGMSVARTWRVRFPGSSIVVKASPRGAESAFYEVAAPRLRAAGVPVVAIDWTRQETGEHWIAMEDVPGRPPEPPADEWRPEPRVVQALARLHLATRGAWFDVPRNEPMRWDPEATESALSAAPSAAASAMRPILDAMQHQHAARLESGWCWISGDASPPNWGIREDGTLAWFDWELFRPGVPASDLAPAVPGLAGAEAVRAMADAYTSEAKTIGLERSWGAEELARDIVTAKVATVVVLLRAHVEGAARVPEAYVAALLESLPGWLERAAAEWPFDA